MPKHERSISQDNFGQLLRKELAQVGGATAYTFAAGGFAGNQKALQLQLQGPDANVLAKLAEPIADSVRATPGAVDVGLSTRGQKPELNVEVNRGLAGSLNVSLGAARAVAALRVRRRRRGNMGRSDRRSRGMCTCDSLPRRARMRRTSDSCRWCSRRRVGGSAPTFVPLRQVATITQGYGPAQIDHFQRQRVVTIGANVLGASVGNVARDVMQRVNKVQLPPGYRLDQGGQIENQNQVFTGMVLALGIAVMLMYLILVIQFGSFLDPLAILVSLPLSLIGVVGALLDHARHAQHHEPHRRDDAHGHRR